MRYELRLLGKLRRVLGLLRFDGNAVEVGDELHVQQWNVHRDEHRLGFAVVLAGGTRSHDLLAHLWELERLWWVQRLLCLDRDTDPSGDQLHLQLLDRNLLRDLDQLGVAVVHAGGARPHELPGADLRGMERVHWRFLCPTGDADEVGDELQLQLRERELRGDLGQREPVVHAQSIGWMQLRPRLFVDLLERTVYGGGPPVRRGGGQLRVCDLLQRLGLVHPVDRILRLHLLSPDVTHLHGFDARR